jgi:hypothetical protein
MVIISLVLFAVGIVLLFFVDSVISPNTQNSTLQTIRNNKLIIGAVCIAVSYYCYTLYNKRYGQGPFPLVGRNAGQVRLNVDTGKGKFDSGLPDYASPNLPSYESTIDTSDALNA